MKRPSPLMQMTTALVALCSALIILGSLFLDSMPDWNSRQLPVRKAIGEALGVQIALMLGRDDPAQMARWLEEIVTHTDGLGSVAVRRDDGTLLLQTAEHARRWSAGAGAVERPEQFTVRLDRQGQRWGRVEFAFEAGEANPLLAFVQEPQVRLLLFVTLAGWLVFWLYLRRALQQLDPASVVPERVQGAFDVMAEGVVLLDAKERVLVANRAFRSLHPELAEMRLGSTLAALPWLAGGLPAEPDRHPWSRAMAERAPNAGTAIEAGRGEERRQLVINAAPIGDAGGSVRGCLVTLNDQSALQRANEALRLALEELAFSKQEVELKNRELESLATRDPLTGLLNRRAMGLAFEPVQRDALVQGRSVACMVIDIDKFKAINDTHGHGIGDRVIQEVARKLQDSVRSTDLVGRWGGEEFCIVVPGIGVAAVFALAQHVRLRIAQECGLAVREVPGLHVTISIGVTVVAQPGDLTELVEQADAALYRAKRNGRNRVELAEEQQLLEM